MKPRPPLSTKAWGRPHLKMGSSRLSSDETAHLKRPHTGQKHPAPVSSCELQASHTHFSLLGNEGLGAPQVPTSLSKVSFAVPPGVKTRLGTTAFFYLGKKKKKEKINHKRHSYLRAIVSLTGGLILYIIFKEVSAL